MRATPDWSGPWFVVAWALLEPLSGGLRCRFFFGGSGFRFISNTSNGITEASMNLRQVPLLLALIFVGLAGCGKTESDQPNQSPSPISQASLSTVVLVAAPATRSAEEPEKNVSYVGSAKRKVYHRSDCRWAKAIMEDNLVTFDSREDAEARGRRSCGTCRP